MSAFQRVVAVGVIVGAAACATSGVNAGTSSSGTPRWTGSFKQSQMASSAVITGGIQSTRSAYGDITITTVDTIQGRSTVDLNVNTPMVGGTQLAWAVFTGPCGSPTPPVTGLNEFPTIEVTSGGARMRLDVHFALRRGTEYHANVYNSNRASDVSNVMMCAPLSASR